MSLRFWAPLCGNAEDRCGNERIYIADEDLVFDGSIRNAWKLNPILINTMSNGTKIYELTHNLGYNFYKPIDLNNDFTLAWWTYNPNENSNLGGADVRFQLVGTTSQNIQQEVLRVVGYIGSSTISFESKDGNVSLTFLNSNIRWLHGWAHHCFKKENNKYSCYINGELINSKELDLNWANDCHNFQFFFGSSYLYNNTTMNVQSGEELDQWEYYSLSDVRFYDEALSPLEIRNLSLGLIAHYNFSEGNYNLLYKSPQLYVPTAYKAYELLLTENLVEGETYTFQFWNIDIKHTGKTDATLGLAVYWGGGSTRLKQWLGTDYFTDGHADYLSFTLTVTSALANGTGASNAWLNIYNSPSSASGERDMTIGAWKVEKKECATNYRLTAQEEEEEHILDHSGFNRHLIKLPASSILPIKYGLDNRYSYIIFESTTSRYQYIKEQTEINHDFTLSGWFNVPLLTLTGTQRSYIKVFGLSIGIRIVDGLPAKIEYFFSLNDINSTGYSYDAQLAFDTWYNIQLIYEKNTLTGKLYLNGKLLGIRTYSDTLVFTNTDWKSGYILKIADFRMYATILSEADLKVIAHNSTLADKSNNLYTGQFIEEVGNINISKNHSIKSNFFREVRDYDPITNTVKFGKNTYTYKDYATGGARFHCDANGVFTEYNNLTITLQDIAEILAKCAADTTLVPWIVYDIYSDTPSAMSDTTQRWILTFGIYYMGSNNTFSTITTSGAYRPYTAKTNTVRSLAALLDSSYSNLQRFYCTCIKGTATSPQCTYYIDNFQIFLAPKQGTNSYPAFFPQYTYQNSNSINWSTANQLIEI